MDHLSMYRVVIALSNVVASEASVERPFSAQKRLQDYNRSCLEEDSVEAELGLIMNPV